MGIAVRKTGFNLNDPFIITQFQQSAVWLDVFLPDHLSLRGEYNQVASVV